MPVAVEKLVPQKTAKNRSRQEALQTIFCGHLDIFYPSISGYFKKKGLFQQPRLLSTVGQPQGKAVGSTLTHLNQSMPKCEYHIEEFGIEGEIVT
jgi:hypothetical protein